MVLHHVWRLLFCRERLDDAGHGLRHYDDLDRQGVLSEVLHEHQYYFLGSLMFAFTVFYAYIHFAQYFIIWNGNMPEETFWYVVREHGTWRNVGLVIIFGHFFLPFWGCSGLM